MRCECETHEAKSIKFKSPFIRGLPRLRFRATLAMTSKKREFAMTKSETRICDKANLFFQGLVFLYASMCEKALLFRQCLFYLSLRADEIGVAIYKSKEQILLFAVIASKTFALRGNPLGVIISKSVTLNF